MDYDVARALARIEDDITASLIRNLKHHTAQETEEGLEWVQWQTVQLQELDKFKRRYGKKLQKEFKRINPHIDEAINEAFNQGKMDEEVAILESIKEGKGKGKAYRRGSSFFQKDNKIEKLINATTNDMEKAEYAILRRANDQYRKIIFDAQMYAASGAGTYEKAVDMATHDFLSAGINCVQYKNGARVSVSKYADMAIRTATKRAYLQGQGEMRQDWGISTVILNKRTSACPLCAPFVGKVFIDDVWSGGKSKDGKYPLLSSAIAAGLYHPNCKDSHTTYFPGVSTKPERLKRRDLVKMEREAKRESKATYCERQAEKCDRLAKYSLDTDKQKTFNARKEKWEKAIINERVENNADLGIIKNITIDDISEIKEILADKFGEDVEIKNEVIDAIYNSLAKFDGLDFYGAIRVKRLEKNIMFQTDSEQFGTWAKNAFIVNREALSGKSVKEIDKMFRDTEHTVCNSLEDGVYHEYMHALTTKKVMFAKYEQLCEAKGYEEISKVAQSDLAETIAEIGVLKKQGKYNTVSERGKKLFEEIIGETKW